MDDRVGCAIMLDLINRDFEYDIYFAFTVQEELGLRGAKTAAFAIEPDFSIVLETTTAADIPDVAGEKRVCELGKEQLFHSWIEVQCMTKNYIK